MLALRAELVRDWGLVKRRLGEASSTDPRESREAAAFVALALDHAYQAFESLLPRVERALGLPPRTGAAWHQAILEDSTIPIEGLRPAIVPPAATAAWQAVMAFRRFLRHAYAVELDGDRLATTTGHLSDAVQATAPGVEELLAALELEPPTEG
jgi:hypothetical protein